MRKILDTVAFILAILAVVILVLWGVAADGDAQTDNIRRVRLMGEFNNADRQQVAKAVDDWNAALGGKLRFVLVDSGDADVSVIGVFKPNGSANSAVTIPDQRRLGTGLIVANVGVMSAAWRPCPLDGAMRHELGHILGEGHVDGGVMAAQCGPEQGGIDAATALRVLARLRRMD